MFGLALREGLLPGLGWNQGQLELRSGLARCFAVPPEPRSETAPLVFGLLFVLAGLVAVGFGAMDNEGLLGAGLLLLALGGILAWSGLRDRASLPRRREQWQAAVDALDERWICHRCGHSWSPTPGPG